MKTDKSVNYNGKNENGRLGPQRHQKNHLPSNKKYKTKLNKAIQYEKL